VYHHQLTPNTINAVIRRLKMLNALYTAVSSATNQSIEVSILKRAGFFIAGTVLTACSGILTVELFQSFASNSSGGAGLAGAIFSFIAGAFEFLSKPLTINTGLYFISRGRLFRGLIFVFIGLCLYSFSIFASLGNLGSTVEKSQLIASQQKQVLYNAQSARDTTKNSIDEITKSINIINAQQAAFINAGKISKATELNRQVQKLNKEKIALVMQLNSNTLPSSFSNKDNEDVKGFSSASSLYRSIAYMFGTNEQKATFIINIFLSILIEVVASASFYISFLHVGDNQKKSDDVEIEPNRGFFGKPKLSLIKSKKQDGLEAQEGMINTPGDEKYTADANAHTRRVCDEKETRFHAAESAKVGDEIECPWCSKRVIKTVINKRFCCSQHKDFYWNEIKPERKDAMKARGRGLSNL
jgi:hypothetical protein